MEQLHGALTSTLEKKIDGAYTRMLRAVLNVYWREHMTNRELYNNIQRITSSIREQRMRLADHCWNELVSDVLLNKDGLPNKDMLRHS